MMREEVIDVLKRNYPSSCFEDLRKAVDIAIKALSAQPEYKPVKAEDFARTMSENTIYSFITWHSEALELMERHGFVICKTT